MYFILSSSFFHFLLLSFPYVSRSVFKTFENTHTHTQYIIMGHSCVKKNHVFKLPAVQHVCSCNFSPLPSKNTEKPTQFLCALLHQFTWLVLMLKLPLKYYNYPLIGADFSHTRSTPLTSQTVSRRRSVMSRRKRNDRPRRRNRDKQHSKIFSQPSNDHLSVLLPPCFNHPPLPYRSCLSPVYQSTIAEILCNTFIGFHSRIISVVTANCVSLTT